MNFRSRGGSSKFKGSAQYKKQKVHNESSSSRIEQDINYNDTSHYNPLFFAVHRGELELTHSLLKKFSLHVKISGRQVIHVAAARGHEQIICLLSHRGAKISKGDINGNTPLHLATIEKHTDVVNLLVTEFTVNLQNLRGETPLHIATQMNNFLFVELLLENGAKVNLQDVGGKTPLHISTGKVNPNMKIVMILLTHGASVHAFCKRGFTPLHFVANSGNVKITEILIDRGASLSVQNENKMDPLCLAIQKNQTEMVEYILGKRTDVDFINIGNMMPLHFAAQAGNEKVVKMLVTEGNAEIINASGEELKTPLHFSAANGHINVVKYLIESGASIDIETEDLNTPLHLSAAAGHLEIVSELLNHGAKIDYLNDEKFTPLCLAVQAGHKEVVSLLLNKGATVEFRKIEFSINDDDCISAFHIAAKSGNLEILKIFLESGIEVDFRKKNGKTALHFSAMFGHTKLVEELVKRGADIHSSTKNFETPLYLAAACGKSETVKYMLYLSAHIAVTSEILIVSPFWFEQYLKITEMLLIKGACVVSKAFGHIITPLHYALKIMVTKDNQLEHASNSQEEFNASKRRLKNSEQAGEFRPEIVRCLLNYGAPVNYSILEVAIYSNCPELLDVLMEYGIEKTSSYEGALRLACKNNIHLILPIAEQISNADTIEELLLCQQDRRINYGTKTMKLLISILVKLRSMSKVNNFVQSKKAEKLLQWYTECELEIINMRLMKVHHQFNLTFYEILTKPVNTLANYVRNKDLMRILDSGVCKKFDLYAPLLERNIKRGKERKALLDSCTECLFSLMRHNCKIQLLFKR